MKHRKGAFSIMIEKIRKQIQQQKWESTLIVAVSGGVDSVVLLHALHNNLPKVKLVVAHVNYHLRQESDGDEQFVKALANMYSAIFESIDWQDIPNTGVERQARDFRYQFFDRLSQKYHTQTIVVAHHADDQAETVLLKMIRGGQVQQLAGMLPHQQKIVRPFLGITKQELINYAQHYQLEWHEDHTNADANYTPRNLLRNKIIPELKSINAQVVTHINDMAEQVANQNALIDAQAKLYENTLTKNWQSVPRLWLIPTIKMYLNTNGIYQIKQKQLQQIEKLLFNYKKPIGEVQLSKNFAFVKSYQQVYLKKALEVANTVQVLPPIMLKLNQWQNFSNNSFQWTDKQPHSEEKCLAFSLKKECMALYLRQPKASDTLSLKHGHKQIRRLAIDNKLSLDERQQMFVLATSDDEIVAVKVRHEWRVAFDFVAKQDAKLFWLAW